MEILEKLTVTQIVKKFSAFYGIRRFFTYSQEPAIDSSPKTDESSLQLPTQFP
jgi:hypothetical protein